MSAPVLTPRPARRPGPGRPASGRSVTATRTPTTNAKGATARTSTARPTTARGAAARTSTASPATGRGATARSSTAAVTAREAAGATWTGRATGGAATARATAPRPASRSGATAAARPRMRVVTRPDVGPRRVGFAITCTAVLGTLMLALLLLNVAISANAFTMAELQTHQGLLVDRQQSLEQQLLVSSAPAALAEKARGLGMVPAPQTIVIAPDGTGAPPVTEPDDGAADDG